ncbi:MAG: integrase [Ottowia sp.]|uniref:integrase n=1 Tax=Ottowia sp. TaxID=1898956 RepID=UPI0039E56229
MPNAMRLIAGRLPRVTPDEVRRFVGTVEVRDAEAFAAELEVFMQEWLQRVELPASLEIALSRQAVEHALVVQAAALKADTRWTPGRTDIQRGREAMLEAYGRPHNLPLPEFAQLANKVRQQIYKDIDARRLLALNVGPRGRKLPDWQLDPVKRRLTQAILQGAPGVDTWTLYRALSDPLEGLNGLSPVDAVTEDSIDAIAKVVFNVLGVH